MSDPTSSREISPFALHPPASEQPPVMLEAAATAPNADPVDDAAPSPEHGETEQQAVGKA